MLDLQKETQKLEKQKYIQSSRKETQTRFEQFKERIKKSKKNPVMVRKTVLDVLPYKSFIHDRLHFIQYKEGFVEVLALQGYNLSGINQDALYDIVYSYRDLIKMYVYPFKVLSLNTPLDTTPQQRYYKKLAQKAKSNIQKQLLMETYYEMKWFSENENNKEFFVLLYAETVSELIENREDFMRYAGSLNIVPITPYKKKTVFFKLNNPMSPILF